MLNKVIKKLSRVLKAAVSGPFWYFKDLIKFRRLTGSIPSEAAFKLFPKIFDKDPASHTFDKHYVYMDRWAFKKIMASQSAVHVDVGSSIRFLSMVTIVTSVTFVDIRPVRLDFDNFKFVAGSILNLPFSDQSVSSLSCLHVAEHIGLGRYGDLLDPQGTIKACSELARVLAEGGSLYFAVPIGKPAVYFNAHRVHDPEIIPTFFPGLDLQEFSVVNDTGHFINRADMKDFKSANYACGMYLFTK